MRELSLLTIAVWYAEAYECVSEWVCERLQNHNNKQACTSAWTDQWLFDSCSCILYYIYCVQCMLNLNAFLIKSEWERERKLKRWKKGQITIMMNGFAYWPFNKCKQRSFHSALHLSIQCTDRRHLRTHSYVGRADTHKGKASNWDWLKSWLNIPRKSPFTHWCSLCIVHDGWHASNALIHESFTPCIVAAENSDKRCELSWAEMSRVEMRWGDDD